MKVIVTGANGFLGHSLVPLLLQKGFKVIATGLGPCRLNTGNAPLCCYEELDFTNKESVISIFLQQHPEFVIHAGAMTRVDDCEVKQDEAFRVNVEGTRHLLEAANTCRAYFLFLSTDFVFSGNKGMYTEEDEPGPVNYYGVTKLAAEEDVKNFPYDWSIVRTCLVYGKPIEGRPNILSTIKDKLEKGEEHKLVDDQYRTPTLVNDLASGIVSILENKAKGLFHISGNEMMTPYEIGIGVAEAMGADTALLKRVNAGNFSQPAKRPPRTGFTIAKAIKELGFHPQSFSQGLQFCLH